MGQGSGVLKPQVIQQIGEETQFSEKDAKELYKLFSQEAATNAKTTYAMTIENFLRIYSASFPGVDCEMFANRVFRVYDTNANEEIDFREFLVGLHNQLTTDESALILNAFNFIDMKKQGIVTFDETVDAIRSIYQLKGGFLPLEDVIEPENFADRIFVRADRRHHETINFQNFQSVVQCSQTAKALVEAINNASCRPYWDRQSMPPPPPRQRSITVMVRKSTNPQDPGNIPMRKFTV